MDEATARKAGQPHSFARISLLPKPSSAYEVMLDSELPDQEQAWALTLRRTIHVSPDASRLPRPEFDRLIAHESVHVAQQDMQGQPGTRSALEQEANDLAPLAVAGRPFQPQIAASPNTALLVERTIGTDAADQRTWVGRVDELVRRRFNLASVRGRMAGRGRVRFQDTETFGRGFGRRPTDLLSEAFAEDLGSLVSRIKRFYKYHETNLDMDPLARAQAFVNTHIGSGFLYWNFHALRLADYGLTGSFPQGPFSSLERVPGNPAMATASTMQHVTRAEAEAAVGRQPGVSYELTDAPHGFTWPRDPQRAQNVTFIMEVPLTRVTERVSAGEILAQTYAGVTSGSTRGRRRIRIQSTPAQAQQPAAGGRSGTPAVAARPANVRTLVHEACHFYTHDNFNRFVDSVRSAGTSHRSPSSTTGVATNRLAPVLAEGFTEFFTQTLMREQAATLGSAGNPAYSSQHTAARLIIGSMNPSSAAETAYFHGSSADLDKVREGISFVESNPDTVRILQGVGSSQIDSAFEGVPIQRPTPRNDRMRPRTVEDAEDR